MDFRKGKIQHQALREMWQMKVPNFYQKVCHKLMRPHRDAIDGILVH